MKTSSSWASAHFMRNEISFLAWVFLCNRTVHICCHACCESLCIVSVGCAALYETVLCVLLKSWSRVLCLGQGSILWDSQHQNSEIPT